MIKFKSSGTINKLNQIICSFPLMRLLRPCSSAVDLTKYFKRNYLVQEKKYMQFRTILDGITFLKFRWGFF